MAIITLTTDFGTRDGYVGAVKGVIARSAPDVTIIDIAHDVPRGDIAHAAWVVATSTLEFPDDTIHVVVVDPGVGGARQAVITMARARAVRAQQWYVGPDNGVFAYLPVERAWEIASMESAPARISATFHGRDVFAYAAASLARGDKTPLAHNSALGRLTELHGQLPWGIRKPGSGRVVHIDIFGNLITDLPAEEAHETVIFDRVHVLPVVKTYESVAVGERLAYVGSANTIEIAVRDGRADEALAAKRGDIVVPVPPHSPGTGPYR